jgi:zinc transport system substrate-binding protein
MTTHTTTIMTTGTITTSTRTKRMTATMITPGMAMSMPATKTANARKMVAEIARVLADADPANAEKYKANAAKSDAAIVALAGDIARELEPVKGKPFVVFHDAYQYFERRFGLSALGSITLNPEAKPSAKRLTEIRKKLGALSASCVFSEPQFQAKLVAAATEGTSARSGILDPEGALVEPGPRAYETLLRNLATGLKTCLVQGS